MATTTICGMLSGAFAVSALAPTAAFAQDAAPAAAPAPADDTTTVIVTGSMLRKKNLTSISPLTVLTAGDLEKRGVTTVDNVAQRLPGNNGGTMTNNWSANGNFAAGASAISLRGLTSNSTLVLVDGMRMAYYPLADDATRNFVDLNTIPDAVIDHVDVLQDGASATYGADAIAGVVNVITKKTFNGFTGKVYGGTSEQGGGNQSGFSGLWGTGNLAEDGWNFYVAAEYQHDDMLKFSERGFPYNTADQSRTCAPSSDTDQADWGGTAASGNVNNNGINSAGLTCRTNGIQNGIQFDDRFTGVGTTTVATVRPYNATGTAAQGNWQLLNPTAGCGNLKSVTITAHQVRQAVAGVPAGTVLCQQDYVNQYNVILPKDERKSVTFHVTKRFNDTTEGYASLNLYQNNTFVSGRNRSIRDTTTPGAAGSVFTTAGPSAQFPGAAGVGIYLPINVCDAGVCKLNPNNPFAAAGQVARIAYLFGDVPYFTTTDSKTARFTAGLKGEAAGWDWGIDLTGMESRLTYSQHGRIYVQHLIDLVNNGKYNFVDPSQNTQATRDYLSPTLNQKSKSQLAQLQFQASRTLMSLAGGPLQLGLGAAFRYEMVNNPSANPDPSLATPTERYFTVNPFGAKGQRTISAASFELDAPLTEGLTVNLSGRYDSYSTGFSHFSPKIKASWKVADFLTFRGAYSNGFRAPAIAETNADPSTGFITLTAPDDFVINEHHNDGYGQSYSVGLTTISSATLKPEKSTGKTLGVIFTPTKYLAFTLDYYNIHKDDIIQGGDYSPALDAYFAGQPIPAGFTIVPGAVDPLYPNATATPGFIQYGLINLSSQDTAGFDASASARFNLGSVRWTSSAEATFISYYTQTYPTGAKLRYDGTLGNNQITSGSGTPKMRWNWQNTFDFGKASISATTYYISGYRAIAADNGDDYHAACEDSATAVFYRDALTPVVCKVKSFMYTDLHGQYQITDHYSVQLDILNAFGTDAPQDPVSTYASTNYNVAFHSPGVMGRYFKLTGKVTF